MPKPYPREFRDDVVRVARSRDPKTPLDQIAKCVIKPDFDLPGKPGKGNH